MKDRIDQTTVIGEHLTARGCNSLSCRRGLTVQTPVHLTAHRGAQIKWLPGAALAQGIGAGSHSLSTQGLQRPAGRHFTADHAGQIGLQADVINGLQGSRLTPQLQLTSVLALLQKHNSFWRFRFQPELSRSDSHGCAFTQLPAHAR